VDYNLRALPPSPMDEVEIEYEVYNGFGAPSAPYFPDLSDSYIDAEPIEELDSPSVMDDQSEADETLIEAPMALAVKAPSAPSFVHSLPPELREQFTRLRSAIMLASESRRLQVVLVCGVAPGDGASFIASNLALTMAEFDKLQVARFEVTASASAVASGNGSYGGDSYQLTLRRTAVPNLRQIASPHGSVSLDDLVRLCDIPAMMEKLRDRFDYVLIDAPAVAAHPETALLAAQADGVILVAQQHATRCESLEAARAALESARAHLLGIVLNQRREN
jgi:Mrp family chromosome partitioning ATPase